MKRKLPKTLTRQDLLTITSSINTRYRSRRRDKLCIEIMYYAGLRVAELCSLWVEHIDGEQGVIRVIDGKGGKDRNVPVSPKLIGLCNKWIVRDNTDNRWLLDTLSGKPLQPRQVQRSCQRISDSIGRKFTPHTLRHSYATGMIQAGVHVCTLKDRLGHASLDTTMIYVHANPEMDNAEISFHEG